MSAPESYLTGYDEVCESLKRVSAGEVREICRSPGGTLRSGYFARLPVPGSIGDASGGHSQLRQHDVVQQNPHDQENKYLHAPHPLPARA